LNFASAVNPGGGFLTGAKAPLCIPWSSMPPKSPSLGEKRMKYVPITSLGDARFRYTYARAKSFVPKVGMSLRRCAMAWGSASVPVRSSWPASVTTCSAPLPERVRVASMVMVALCSSSGYFQPFSPLSKFSQM
ncbi:MAG: DUF2263 domain-containing protein, partial [Myxococcaceae bacterium]